VYCHDRVGRDGNLTFRSRGPHFLEDLAGCKAIVGTAGFSLIADAIHLRKPYFAVPLKRQFEQTHNAAILTASGLGESAEEITPALLRRFLGRLSHYRARLDSQQFDPTEQGETLRELLARIRPARSPIPAAPLRESSLET
jgi:uncharacterized protein (TIGR00661 family)